MLRIKYQLYQIKNMHDMRIKQIEGICKNGGIIIEDGEVTGFEYDVRHGRKYDFNTYNKI
jgi:hypothetical protein